MLTWKIIDAFEIDALMQSRTLEINAALGRISRQEQSKTDGNGNAKFASYILPEI